MSNSSRLPLLVLFIAIGLGLAAGVIVMLTPNERRPSALFLDSTTRLVKPVAVRRDEPAASPEDFAAPVPDQLLWPPSTQSSRDDADEPEQFERLKKGDKDRRRPDQLRSRKAKGPYQGIHRRRNKKFST